MNRVAEEEFQETLRLFRDFIREYNQSILSHNTAIRLLIIAEDA